MDSAHRRRPWHIGPTGRVALLARAVKSHAPETDAAALLVIAVVDAQLKDALDVSRTHDSTAPANRARFVGLLDAHDYVELLAAVLSSSLDFVLDRNDELTLRRNGGRLGRPVTRTGRAPALGGGGPSAGHPLEKEDSPISTAASRRLGVSVRRLHRLPGSFDIGGAVIWTCSCSAKLIG